MIQSAAVEQFKAVCEEVTKDPVGILIVNSKWGSINFESAKEELETIFGIVHSLKNVPLEVLPQGEFNPLNEALNQVSTQIKSIRTFSIEQGNATQARNTIVDGLKNVGSNLYTQSQARLPFLALQRGDVKKNEEAFAKAVREAEALMKHATDDVKAKGAEIESIIAAARDAAATVGVAHFTADFNGTADGLEKTAREWLWCTGGLAVATVLGALAFPFVFTSTGTTIDMHAIQLFTSKLVALGALFTATVWCGHMFKATKHQAAINRHRGNALKTFQAFVKATTDDQIRDAVLMETTRSIFAMVSTGYLDGVENPGDGALKMIEVVKSAASVGK